jgi:hypothetical protein
MLCYPIAMQIGTMFFGKVDAALGESVQTKFFVLGMPLFPISSYYAMSDHGTGISGFEIPLHGKSTLLGLVRVWSGIGAFVVGLLAFIDKRGDLLRHAWTWFAVLTAICLVSTFALGRASKHTLLGRVIRKHATGIGAPVAYVPSEVAENIRTTLLAEWTKANPSMPWERAIDTGQGGVLLYTLADYHGRPELAARCLENLSEVDAMLTGPYR